MKLKLNGEPDRRSGKRDDISARMKKIWAERKKKMGIGKTGEDSELSMSYPAYGWGPMENRPILYHIIDVRVERKEPIPSFIVRDIQKQIYRQWRINSRKN